MDQKNKVGYKVVDFFEEKKSGSRNEIIDYAKKHNEEFPMLSEETIEECVIAYVGLLKNGMLIKYDIENNKYERSF